MSKIETKLEAAAEYAGACKVMNIDPDKLPGIEGLPEAFGKDITARYKMMVVVAAVHKLLGFVPDYGDSEQKKYELFYWLKRDPSRASGFGFDDVGTHCVYSATFVGVRLVFPCTESAYFIDSKYRDIIMDMIA